MHILIVDDEINIRESLKMILEQEGYEVSCAENGLSAQRMLEVAPYDAGIFDLKMPGMDGLELLKWLKETGLDLPVIMISAFGQVEDAVSALKNGAEDYITKPFEPDLLIEKLKLWDSMHNLEDNFKSGRNLEDDFYFLGKGPEAEKLYTRMKRVARTQSNVLITGESGVGKEVSARLIHDWSEQKDAPFVALNVGGVPENLLESELFGYEQGAFTGADKMKQGLLETASGGSLFLDEIGEMPLNLQVKLLRVLQDRSFRRLGGLKDLTIDSRIITATNRNLEEMVQDGSFREDLYYRLNVARLAIPPLRSRMDDLPRLTGFLLEKLNRKMDMHVETLSREAWEKLNAYSFPGNIRELENLLERAMIFAEGDVLSAEELELSDINVTKAQIPEGFSTDGGRTLKEQEKDSILAALHRWEGNRSHAAKELGISRRTIINKIKEYGLDE
ncbi:sigma-54-dependent Fis family transcriptional regulator [Oceanispirochaeta crateris]|uniref:Sigma-54-dependent Fis family transcriptional regulator n=1 Tax=Oceanispirochaeta crateris TaxID=2518645 RepID=A0A5C1QLH7_9SPIO|nr:sigma-54 dependent transcriptional regulator [Oceanispirochaeta crateris]QEN08481.1 sigma-54-dependent Fis family transcriptional regulator [Oceanispirochaeta crateris]